MFTRWKKITHIILESAREIDWTLFKPREGIVFRVGHDHLELIPHERFLVFYEKCVQLRGLQITREITKLTLLFNEPIGM